MYKSVLDRINGLSQHLSGAKNPFFAPCSLPLISLEGEAGCVRIILYLYSLFYECGAKPLRFCLRQTQFGEEREDIGSSLTVLHSLRTTNAHTLDIDSERSQGLKATANSFYRLNLGRDYPTTSAEWTACARAVGKIGTTILISTEKFLEQLATEADMVLMKECLRRSIDAGFSREDFEKMAPIVVKELGRLDIDPGKLVFRHLETWTRRISLLPEGEDIVVHCRKAIEETILIEPKYLAISGADIVALGVPAGPKIGQLLTFAKGLNIDDRAELLAKVEEKAKASLMIVESRDQSPPA